MKLVLVVLSLVVSLSACTGIGIPPAEADQVRSVSWTHDGTNMDGTLIADFSLVRFKKYCGTASRIYTIPPVDMGHGEFVDGQPNWLKAPIDIDGPDGSYWCALTAFNADNPDAESPYSSEYQVLKSNGLYYYVDTMRLPFGIKLIK